LIQQQDDNPAETQMAISNIPRMRAIFISGLGVLNEFSPSESDTFVQAASPAISYSGSLHLLNSRASHEGKSCLSSGVAE
jgi:hypothetical protein